jgi:hypothetical protein
MVDERTQLKFSGLFDTKNGMVEETYEQLHRWQESGRGAEIIRLDNAGENKLLQQRSQSADWKLNVKFEFTHVIHRNKITLRNSDSRILRTMTEH